VLSLPSYKCSDCTMSDLHRARNCTGVPLRMSDGRMVPDGQPAPLPAEKPAYPNGLFDIAAEAGSMAPGLAKVLEQTVDGSAAISHCARLLLTDTPAEWIEHYKAIRLHLRAPVADAPFWYKGHMLTLHSAYLDAQQAHNDALAERRKNGNHAK
jgi:hypothetical protein